MTDRLPDAYFADVYATTSDPWRLAERWYEQRKYAITMAMLPKPRYRSAFEPGCSVGVLTELLAARCDALLATDVAQAALDTARTRLEMMAVWSFVTMLSFVAFAIPLMLWKGLNGFAVGLGMMAIV